MSEEEHDALFESFERVFVDMCARGLADFDPLVLDRLWCAFLKDMAAGFPSFLENRYGKR